MIPLYRMQLVARGLARDFYESMLMLTLGLLMQSNEWHMIRLLNKEKLPVEMTEPPALSWSTIFFSSGLLLTLLQYRPKWIKRCSSPLRKSLLLLEVFMLLYLVDYCVLAMWHPFFNIVDQALHTLGHSKWNWAKFIFYYCPSCSVWLINDGFYFTRFVVSLSWFLIAIDMAAPKWRMALDYLLLGQLPEIVTVRRRRRQKRSKN